MSSVRSSLRMQLLSVESRVAVLTPLGEEESCSSTAAPVATLIACQFRQPLTRERSLKISTKLSSLVPGSVGGNTRLIVGFSYTPSSLHIHRPFYS